MYPYYWKHPYTVLYTAVYIYHHWSWRFKAQPPKNAQAVDPLSPDSISQTDIHRTWPIYAHLNKCNIACIYWLWRYAVRIYIYIFVRVLKSYCVWACFSFWWNVYGIKRRFSCGYLVLSVDCKYEVFQTMLKRLGRIVCRIKTTNISTIYLIVHSYNTYMHVWNMQRKHQQKLCRTKCRYTFAHTCTAWWSFFLMVLFQEFCRFWIIGSQKPDFPSCLLVYRPFFRIGL